MPDTGNGSGCDTITQFTGDEVYGSCTGLREHFEAEGQAYVLRVPSSFMISLAAGVKMTCAQAVRSLLKDQHRREVRSAGQGSKGNGGTPGPGSPPPPRVTTCSSAVT